MYWRRVVLPIAFMAARTTLAVPPEVGPITGACEQAFEDFVQRFGKTYSGSERQRRFAVFRTNYEIIKRHNAEGHSYTLGITRFADLTPQEFASAYGLPKQARFNASGLTVGSSGLLGTHHKDGSKSLPPTIDWRHSGAVSPVKNQGQCGGCYAFATAGTIEGAWQIATGQLASLSAQQFVDCTLGGEYGGLGCKGGNLERTLAYATKNGLCNSASYQYQAAAGTCTDKCRVVIPSGGVKGYKHVDPQDDGALMEAVAQQPVAVLIEADQTAFQLYTGGVLAAECGQTIDHAVLAVGYGSLEGQDYWLVKNSWGGEWGESGYVRLARGKGAGGECGITSTPGVYAVVDASVARPVDILPSLVAGGCLFGALCLVGSLCLVRARCRGARSARDGQLLAAPASARARPASARETAAGNPRTSRLLQASQSPPAPASQV